MKVGLLLLIYLLPFTNVSIVVHIMIYSKGFVLNEG